MTPESTAIRSAPSATVSGPPNVTASFRYCTWRFQSAS